MRPQTILFDLDNTLVPFLGPLKTWAEAWANHAAPAHIVDDVKDTLITGTLDGAENPQRGIQRVQEAWNIGPKAKRANAIAEAAYQDAIEPYPGICGLLGHLWRNDATLGLVTDAPRDRALIRLDGAGLAQLFDIIITRDETPHGKRGPEPFRLALDVLGTNASQTVMIGDWPAFDVRWPQHLGMDAILAGWGIDPDDPRAPDPSPPCPIASHPSEIPEILREAPRTAEPRTPQTPQATVNRQAALSAF